MKMRSELSKPFHLLPSPQLECSIFSFPQEDEEVGLANPPPPLTPPNSDMIYGPNQSIHREFLGNYGKGPLIA